MYGSRTILAKDIIGWAQELAAVEEARLALNALGRTFYNMAVAEIYSLLGYVDTEALLNKQTLTVGAAISGKYYAISLLTGGVAAQTSGSLTVGIRYRINTFVAGDNFINVGAPSNASGIEFTAIGTTPTTWINSSSLQQVPLYNYDKIVSLEMTNSSSTTLVGLQCFGLAMAEFLRHKSNSASGIPAGAMHPYEESVVYSIADTVLHILLGSSITASSPAAYIYYTRQPQILNAANFDTAYMDLPDKYAGLLANRIAAYAELRQGISDKSMALVTQSYQQMGAALDPQLRAKIMESFQFKPAFTANESRG
ncbi:MAG: hypothetical protein ACYC2U_04720 [Candidatus Amoebophilus sp.]